MTRATPARSGRATSPQFRAHPSRVRVPGWRGPTFSMHPGFDGWGRTLRQSSRHRGQELHELLYTALQLRVMAFQYFHRVLFDDDIRIHSVPLDDPTAVLICRAELWHKYGAAVEQRSVVVDPDHTAPGALADECADFPLAERVRKNITVGCGVLIDQCHFRSRLHDARIGIRRLVIARKAGTAEGSRQPLDQQLGNIAAAVVAHVDHQTFLSDLRIPPFDEFTDPGLAHVG